MRRLLPLLLLCIACGSEVTGQSPPASRACSLWTQTVRDDGTSRQLWQDFDARGDVLFEQVDLDGDGLVDLAVRYERDSQGRVVRTEIDGANGEADGVVDTVETTTYEETCR